MSKQKPLRIQKVKQIEPVGDGLLAIIGGSGIQDCPLFAGAPWFEFDTEYSNEWGDGKVYAQLDADQGIVFIPRHGLDGLLDFGKGQIEKAVRYGPAKTQYGSNIILAAALGAGAVIGVSATGSVNPNYRVKDLVIPDDYDDQSGRDDNLFGKGIVVHANPSPAFSEELRSILLQDFLISGSEPPKRKGSPLSRGSGVDEQQNQAYGFNKVLDMGVYCTIPGDRFGTKAEGKRRAQFSQILGMTLCPEASMAMQANMHYACAAIVVDENLDANHEKGTLAVMRELSEPGKLPAYMARVAKAAKKFAASTPKLKQLEGNIIPGDIRLIKNPYLRWIAEDLIKEYCPK